MAFSPDGRTFASFRLEGPVHLWEAATGRHLGEIRAGEVLTRVAYSPDSKILAVHNLDRITLWDTVSFQQVASLEGEFKGIVQAIAFSPDGKMLAAANDYAQLWDLSTGRRIGPLLTRQSGTITTMVFTPDGKHLIAGSTGMVGRPIVWDLTTEAWEARACRRANRNLSMEEWRQFIGDILPYRKTCPDLPPGEGAPER